MRTLLYLDGENLHWSLTHHHSRKLDPGVVLHLAAAVGEVEEEAVKEEVEEDQLDLPTKSPSYVQET